MVVEKWLNSEYNLKEELTAFADGLTLCSMILTLFTLARAFPGSETREPAGFTSVLYWIPDILNGYYDIKLLLSSKLTFIQLRLCPSHAFRSAI